MFISVPLLLCIGAALYIGSLCDTAVARKLDWTYQQALRDERRLRQQRRHARRALEARRVAMAARTFQYSWWWGLCYLSSAGQCHTPAQLNRYVTLVEQYWDKWPTPLAPWPAPHPYRPGLWPVEPL